MFVFYSSVFPTSIGEGKPFKAYHILKDCQSAKNRYKFALTCIKLNKYHEAELALTGAKLPQNQLKYGDSFTIPKIHLNDN